MVTDSENHVQLQAIEAIVHDAVSLLALLKSVLQHERASLLVQGIVPIASMVVIETFEALVAMFPFLQQILETENADLFRASRHRAKLLDGSKKSLDYSLDYIASELTVIAREQRDRFVDPHTGIFGSIKKKIQPDLGLSTIEGHIFSTTHAVVFGFGRGADYEAKTLYFGYELAQYLQKLVTLFNSSALELTYPFVLNGKVEMRDIKYESLYQRGRLGNLKTEYAAGLTVLLASLNYVHYILRSFFPARDLTLFRLKFLVAFHADSSLSKIQAITKSTTLSNDVLNIFADALGNSDSRWLRKRRTLRNLLMHYLVDERSSNIIPLEANRREAITLLCGNLSYDEVDDLLDRHIFNLSTAIENGFNLSGDPFWYGKIS